MSKFLFLTTFLASFTALMFGLPFTSQAETRDVEFQIIDTESSLDSFSKCSDDALPVQFDGEYLSFHSAGLIHDAAEMLDGCRVEQIDLHIINRQGSEYETAYKSAIEGFLSDHNLKMSIKVQSVYAEGKSDIEGQGVLNILVEGSENSA